jgi:hypothetical protein
MRIASIAAAVVLAFSANVYASYMDSLRARCEAYGSTPGTRDFYQCLHDVNALEERKREQKPLEPALARCDVKPRLLSGTDMLASPGLNSQSVVVSQLSEVSLSACSAQLQ